MSSGLAVLETPRIVYRLLNMNRVGRGEAPRREIMYMSLSIIRGSQMPENHSCFFVVGKVSIWRFEKQVSANVGPPL